MKLAAEKLVKLTGQKLTGQETGANPNGFHHNALAHVATMHCSGTPELPTKFTCIHFAT